MAYEHIKHDLRNNANLPAKERIKICRHDIWIDTPRYAPLFESLRNMLYTDNQIQSASIFIHGDGGDGKTALFNRLKALGELEGKRFVFITLTENVNRFKLHDALCDVFDVPIGKRGTAVNRVKLITKKIETLGIGAIVIDELSDCMLEAYSHKKSILSLLRGLAEGDGKLCVIAFGNSVASEIIALDRIIDRRFVPWHLKPWKLDQDFVDFIATYETYLPLKLPSNLASPKLRTLIHVNSHGILDNIVKIIKSTAMDAIKHGTEQITPSQFQDLESITKLYGYKLHRPKDAELSE